MIKSHVSEIANLQNADNKVHYTITEITTKEKGKNVALNLVRLH